MSRPGPVALNDRIAAHQAALQAADRAAERWLHARARGLVPASLDEALTGAIAQLTRTDRRLTETRKRLARTALRADPHPPAPA